MKLCKDIKCKVKECLTEDNILNEFNADILKEHLTGEKNDNISFSINKYNGSDNTNRYTIKIINSKTRNVYYLRLIERINHGLTWIDKKIYYNYSKEKFKNVSERINTKRSKSIKDTKSYIAFRCTFKNSKELNNYLSKFMLPDDVEIINQIFKCIMDKRLHYRGNNYKLNISLLDNSIRIFILKDYSVKLMYNILFKDNKIDSVICKVENISTRTRRYTLTIDEFII